MGVTSATRTGCLAAVLIVFGIVLVVALTATHKPAADPPPAATAASTPTQLSDSDRLLADWALINMQAGKGACDSVAERTRAGGAASADKWIVACKNGRRFTVADHANGIGGTVEELAPVK